MKLAEPYFSVEEFQQIKEVLESGYLTQGPKVAEFEKRAATYLKSDHAFAMSSCTTALHLALVVAGIEEGDEVLLPDFTFPATANVVIQQKAKPILVDIDLTTYTIDLEDLRSKITQCSKAIIPVHLFGLSADMSPILELAKEHNLTVIEDAACALGAGYKGRFCGTLGDLGCFSFHPRKVITTGEGGMVITDNQSFAEQISLLRNHGGVREEGRYTFYAAGFNYRLSDLQGALGIAQMKKLDFFIRERRKLAHKYNELLKGISGLYLPVEPEGFKHIYQTYAVRLDTIDRDVLIRALGEEGIETTIGTYALHTEPFFRKTFGYQLGDLPNSFKAGQTTLALPLYPGMSLGDIYQISNVLKGLL